MLVIFNTTIEVTETDIEGDRENERITYIVNNAEGQFDLRDDHMIKHKQEIQERCKR